MGIPVLTGAIFRLPAGMLTDKFGGKPIYGGLLLLCAVPMYMLQYADSFLYYALCSAAWGLAGVSFSIGIAFSSVWYPKKRQGTALGIFGAGNAGAALTTMFAPTLLSVLTDGGTNIEGWRQLPVFYASALVIMGIVFLMFSTNKKPASSSASFVEMLVPLKQVRVWRFGLYYFLVFGCFIAFSQWLVPYFVNVYTMSLVTAGLLASAFSLPSGVIRAFGDWLSDAMGARSVMYWVLGLSVVISLMLSIPKMDIYSPGEGIMAAQAGTVTEVSPTVIAVGDRRYTLTEEDTSLNNLDDQVAVLPKR